VADQFHGAGTSTKSIDLISLRAPIDGAAIVVAAKAGTGAEEALFGED
jgi:hypothetical protein